MSKHVSTLLEILPPGLAPVSGLLPVEVSTLLEILDDEVSAGA